MKFTPYFYGEHDHKHTGDESQLTYKWTEINMNKKFSSLSNCNIISNFIKKLIFMKEMDYHF